MALYKIKLRRSTASDWTAVNPVLAEGEFGYELDTRNFKIGDGTTAWNALGYVIDENDRLPDASSLDDGQILLTFGGQWVVVDLPSGLPDPTGVPDGYMIATLDDSWVVQAIPASPTELPNPAGLADGLVLLIEDDAWVPGTPGSATISTEYTATAGQTAFVLPSTPIPGTVRVWRNGLLQATTHWTWDLGTLTVTLTDACVVNEKIVIVQDGPVGAILSEGPEGPQGDDGPQGIPGVDGTRSPLVINDQTGTTYTLALADATKWVRLNNAAAITLTVPLNSVAAFPIGTQIEGSQAGAGQVTIAGAGGVTVNSTPGLKVANQYGVFGLLKVATDTWLAYGRLSA